MKRKSIMAIALALVMSLACLAGCGQQDTVSDVGSVSAEAEAISGGVLIVKVNPEIAVSYDESGVVTDVSARNDDAKAIIEGCGNLAGQQTKDVVTQLVTAIGTAGYFAEEIEGGARQITIEIEPGSQLPSDTFLDEVVSGVRECVNNNNWQSPLEVENESDYGITNYVDTDYGPNNDGATNYDDTDYGPNNDGVTDYTNSSSNTSGGSATNTGSSHNSSQNNTVNYDDTDYGPNNDGVTDYNDTDYGPNNDGVTNYDDTDYGPNNDGVTNYDDTDYGPNNDGVTNYDDTDYGPNNDGVTNYDDGQSNYDDGQSNYDDGQSSYDDGQSDYDDGQSNYDD